MGLGNHKRKMSISLSIILIFPHTVANLVQTRGRGRKSTTAYDMRPVILSPQCPEWCSCKIFHSSKLAPRVVMSKVSLIGKDALWIFALLFCTFFFFPMIWGFQQNWQEVEQCISANRVLARLLHLYSPIMKSTAGLPFIKLDHWWAILMVWTLK